MEVLRRKALRAASRVVPGVSVNLDLNLVITEEKALCSALAAVAAHRQAASASFERWARNEDNPAVRDICGKLIDLNRAEGEAFSLAAEAQLQYRDVFKDILREERQLDQIRKHYEKCKGKLAKAAAKTEADTAGGSEQLEASYKQAEMEFASGYFDAEVSKVERLKKGLVHLADVKQTLAHRLQVLAKAEQALAALLPTELPHVSGEQAYEMGPEKSDVIVCKAIAKAKLLGAFEDEEVPTPSEPVSPTTPTHKLRGTSSRGGSKPGSPRPLRRGSSVAVSRPAKPTDAFDVLGMQGEVLQTGLRSTDTTMSGVSHKGQPLQGSKSVRGLARQYRTVQPRTKPRLARPPSTPVPLPRHALAAETLPSPAPPDEDGDGGLYVSPDTIKRQRLGLATPAPAPHPATLPVVPPDDFSERVYEYAEPGDVRGSSNNTSASSTATSSTNTASTSSLNSPAPGPSPAARPRPPLPKKPTALRHLVVEAAADTTTTTTTSDPSDAGMIYALSDEKYLAGQESNGQPTQDDGPAAALVAKLRERLYSLDDDMQQPVTRPRVWALRNGVATAAIDEG